MLSIKTVQRLKKLGIEANKVEDFASGIKLLQLVCQVYYNGENPALSAKIKMIDQAKTGVHVLNINILLNYIKKDPNIQLPEELKDMTAFKLLEEQQSMIGLIDFLLSRASNEIKQEESHEMSPARQQQNELDNLYFVASLEKKVHIDDSLQIEDHSEKVVRKGSFKVLKPRASSDSKRQTSGSKDSSNEKRQMEDISVTNKSKKEPLRQIYNIQPNYIQVEQTQQLIARKTIPKMLQRPPLYRSRQRDSAQSVKQKNDTYNNDKKHTPLMTASQTDRQTIIKNIEHINFQIAEQQKSLNLINSSINQSRVEQTKSKSTRKVFKIDLPDVSEPVRKRLLEWLIEINILGLKAAKYTNQLQNICKDGIIFIQILNYYRGRGKNISYFKEPKRNAQMHSNYQKLFSVLQEYITFRSQLLHQYEFFIPQAHNLAFWNLLLSIYECFNRQRKPKAQGINRYQNSVSKVVQKSSSKKIGSEAISYKEIKLNNNSSSKEKKDTKSNFSSIQLPRKQTPKPVKSMKSQQSEERNIPYGLVQNEEPQEQNIRTQRGYKQMYLCKFKNMETPSKNRSFTINSSLTKSRIRSSLGSAKKNEAKPVLPSITLQMQMGVLKYLKSYPTEDENMELFRDPYRNGVLICSIIQKEWMIDCFASRRPKNIDDCRNNFLNAIELIKNKLKNLKVSYEYFVQDLLKGEKSLLYGLIWNIIKEPIDDGKNHQQQPFSYIQLEDKSMQKSLQSEQKISWVREMEKHSSQIALMRIRTQEQLYSAVINTDFLFYYSYFITGKKSVTPNYQRPINYIQKESNLKKVLSFLVQSKIIRSDYLWKSKFLLKRQGTILEEFVSDLIAHFNRLFKKNQMKAVNFIKYIRPEQSEEKQKPIQKLETTMANQTINNHHSQIMAPPQLQINWMRKLGFGQSLELNNGVLLCRLLAKLMMKSINGLNENPQTRAQCLGNIRKAIKLLPKFKWDEYDVLESDYNKNLEIYAFLRDQFKHSYAFRSLI